MSRIGKKIIVIPDNIDVSLLESKIIFSNANIRRELETFGRVSVAINNKELSFYIKENNIKQSKAFWGTYRALANNIVEGMSKGFIKQLEINGVGYRASVNNRILELYLGFSHPVNYNIPDNIDISVDKNLISIKGIDKQQVGQVASEIRRFRPPEPYKGKGIKYFNETILRKAGKTAKK